MSIRVRVGTSRYKKTHGARAFVRHGSFTWRSASVDRLTSYDDSASNEGDDEEDQEDDEKDLGEFRGCAGDATEAECSCDQSNEQESFEPRVRYMKSRRTAQK